MTTAEEFKEIGNDHFKRQEFDLAIAAYNKAIELNPQDCAFWLNRSNAYRQQSCWELAEEDTQEALRLSPGNAKALYGSAMCLRKLEQLPAALKRCEEGIQLHPENKAFRQLHREVLSALVRQQAREPPTTASSRSSSVDSDESQHKHPVRPVREDEIPSQELGHWAMKGDAENVMRLLQGGADVNWKRPKDGNSALHLSAEMGHIEVVQLLLASRADPEIHNDFALSPFALAQHDSSVETLLAQVTKPLGEHTATEEG